jgi:hypothetical protein
MDALTQAQPEPRPRVGPVRLGLVLAAAVAGLILASGSLAMRSDAHAGGATAERAQFHDAMRGLWEEHVAWTRMFIVSFVADVPDLGATTDRLLRNQDDIGNAIRPFYGDAAADELTELLREHILGAAQLLAAAKAGDADGIAAASEAWYANANEIADFLAAANPREWSAADLRAMMKEHLDLTLAEAVAQLQGNYVDAVAHYDTVEVQIRHMADMLSDGIIAQFPAKFSH